MFLDHTACNNDLSALFLFSEKLSYCINPLLAGGSKKATRIDNEIIGLFHEGCRLVSAFEQNTDHHLAIDEIASAAERYKMKFILKVKISVEHGKKYTEKLVKREVEKKEGED